MSSKFKLLEKFQIALPGLEYKQNTRKGEKMVEYALSGMDNNLFVSSYMLHLPNKAKLESFLKNEIKDLKDKK